MHNSPPYAGNHACVPSRLLVRTVLGKAGTSVFRHGLSHELWRRTRNALLQRITPSATGFRASADFAHRRMASSKDFNALGMSLFTR